MPARTVSVTKAVKDVKQRWEYLARWRREGSTNLISAYNRKYRADLQVFVGAHGVSLSAKQLDDLPSPEDVIHLMISAKRPCTKTPKSKASLPAGEISVPTKTAKLSEKRKAENDPSSDMRSLKQPKLPDATSSKSPQPAQSIQQPGQKRSAETDPEGLRSTKRAKQAHIPFSGLINHAQACYSIASIQFPDAATRRQELRSLFGDGEKPDAFATSRSIHGYLPNTSRERDHCAMPLIACVTPSEWLPEMLESRVASEQSVSAYLLQTVFAFGGPGDLPVSISGEMRDVCEKACGHMATPQTTESNYHGITVPLSSAVKGPASLASVLNASLRSETEQTCPVCKDNHLMRHSKITSDPERLVVKLERGTSDAGKLAKSQAAVDCNNTSDSTFGDSRYEVTAAIVRHGASTQVGNYVVFREQGKRRQGGLVEHATPAEEAIIGCHSCHMADGASQIDASRRHIQCRTQVLMSVGMARSFKCNAGDDDLYWRRSSLQSTTLCHNMRRLLQDLIMAIITTYKAIEHIPLRMESDILDGLNAAQRTAVTSDADVLQVLAPPGSGKTKTLTARVAWLLGDRQLKPWNIIVCTFTVKAASEMKQRITNFVGEECAKQLRLGTFHSVAVRYLRRYGQLIGLNKDFGIADASDSKAIIKRIIKQQGLTIDDGPSRSRISAQKARGINSQRYAQAAKKADQEFLQVYQEYEATLVASNLLDYDDLILRCCDLLRAHPDCVANVEALLIDEFQDTNTIQYELMALFAQRRNVITIVGDPDQSIYGFRSAEIQNLNRMTKQWPDTLTINLEENYRSSGAILHAAQHIIEQDTDRPPKKLQATHTFGLRPVLRKLPSAPAEAAWLVAEVKRLMALTGDLLQPSDFAVLLRSAALSRVIESALGKEGVPYRMIGGTKFYDRIEVKTLIDYLRVIATPDNSEAVERVINVPPRRIGDASVESLHKEARKLNISLWRLVLDTAQGRSKPTTKLPSSTMKGLESFADVVLTCRKKLANAEGACLIELINTVLKKLSYQDWLKKKYPDDHDTRWTNVEELLAQATDASESGRMQAEFENHSPTPAVEQEPLTLNDALSAFLANIALTTSSAEKTEHEGQPTQQLTLSTIHAAKGLEWPVVFIPACYDGSIPHSRAEDHDEERRLLYVGMTRAQAVLYLSTPLKDSQRAETCTSKFLTEPGVARFFEEHGPAIAGRDVQGLARTLHRTCPDTAAIRATAQFLARDQDNYWPLDGEEPPEERDKWNYGRQSTISAAFGGFQAASSVLTNAATAGQQHVLSTANATTQPGFVSCRDRYQEALGEAQLKKVDKRAEEQARASAANKPKGRKRQMEGQGTLSSFFGKPDASTSAYQDKRTDSQDDPAASARTLRSPSYPIPARTEAIP
ncbi:hypothetical protein BAUCODRAFT_25859 [Baudoinia panamericana UAMH 10762]|uniref:DNA 3'-5' helicase n=1 Tax=Baudoinia panamericana (strain UAMH 10762) TaxID=717646 RepID=M2LKD6_BAUPA|nr:uncharacterized protein BAUCODRAFT_25859 [Baudoinia panamericana UAMH 10762]EMC94732.1 hypothetical protein BAUCODRAFT_25859 [Baudoinia panamericana UAMH 10762]